MQYNDSTIINKLWWLRKFLNDSFKGKEYKDICRKELSVDICKEVDEASQKIYDSLDEDIQTEIDDYILEL